MDDNDGFAFVFIRNRTISSISGSFFSVTRLSRSKQTKPRESVHLSVFPVTMEALSLTKTATSPSVLKRQIMIDASL